MKNKFEKTNPSNKKENSENIDQNIEQQKEELLLGIKELEEKLKEIGGEEELKKKVNSLNEEKLIEIYEKIRGEFNHLRIGISGALIASGCFAILFDDGDKVDKIGAIHAFLIYGGVAYMASRIFDTFNKNKNQIGDEDIKP